MKVIIFGSDGQLGSELVKQLEADYSDYELFKTTINDLDITDYNSTKSYVQQIKPDLILNCAAHTNVDDCENDIDLAYKVNALGSRNIAIAAGFCNSEVVYISTDYIFDGSKSDPYTEFDLPNPLNIYGKSKLMGENYLKDLTKRYYILRTSWLYGQNGNNFLKTIIRLAEKNSKLRIVDDQIGSPTDVKSLASQILHIINKGKYGTYHASCNGCCSWYEFAAEIVKMTGLNADVIPIATKDYPLPAKRPKFSVLENYVLRLDNDDVMPHWNDSLRYFLDENSMEDLK